MAKQKLVENNENVELSNSVNFDIDDKATPDVVEFPIQREVPVVGERPIVTHNRPLINCLKNLKVIVRHINKLAGIRIDNPNHIAYGGMLRNAKKTFCVPMLSSGLLVNVLTTEEKDYLEYIMGLEPNALSIYKKPAAQNFWSTANPNGISTVTLLKGDNLFDLSSPSDYIKYKILLANKERIASSMASYEDSPKATYEFVIVNEGDEATSELNNMNVTMRCYMLFGKFQDDSLKLRTIIEALEGKPMDPYTKLPFLKAKHNELIQLNPKLYEKVANDPLLDTKCLIKQAIEVGIISNRGNYYYIRETNEPLCDNGLEPTLNIAAQYLANPRYLEIKFNIEAKIKALKQ